MSIQKPQAPIVTRMSTCLCKSVTFTITGQDKGAVLCHCSNCKQSSGSAFMHNHRFTKCEIEFIRGQDLVKAYKDSDTKSGATLQRHFCSNCGSSLYLENSAFKGFAAMNAGNMQEETCQPSMELFVENKYAWIGDVTGKGGDSKL